MVLKGRRSKAKPEITKHPDGDQEAEGKDHDKFRAEDGEIHEDEFHIHHWTVDKESELGGLRDGKVGGDEGV